MTDTTAEMMSALASDDNEKLVEAGYQSIRHLFRSGKFTVVTVTPAVAILMKMMEKYPDLTGLEKKRMVIAVLQKAIVDSDMEEEEKVMTQLIVDQLVPDVIDLVVSAARGKMGLHKIKQGCASCFGGK